jgi:hypothetical protein
MITQTSGDQRTHHQFNSSPRWIARPLQWIKTSPSCCRPGAAPGVDVVYTYVDGTDPEWRKLLEATARAQPDAIALNEFGNRYREWGELKYSMRYFIFPFVCENIVERITMSVFE